MSTDKAHFNLLWIVAVFLKGSMDYFDFTGCLAKSVRGGSHYVFKTVLNLLERRANQFSLGQFNWDRSKSLVHGIEFDTFRLGQRVG